MTGEAVAGLVVLVGLPTLAGVVWAVRQEGRINGLGAKYDYLAERHADLKSDLVYIRERIDRALNGQ